MFEALAGMFMAMKVNFCQMKYHMFKRQDRVVAETIYLNEVDKVDEKEYDEIINYAYDLGIRNAFIQEDSSQSDSFIPSFKGDMII